MADIQRGEHQQRGDHRAGQMVAEQPPLAGAAQTGGEDKFALAQETTGLRTILAYRAQCDSAMARITLVSPVPSTPTIKRQDRGRKSHKQFGDAHQAAVGAAAQQSGAAADRRADQQHQQQTSHHRPQRNAGGGQQA